MLNSNGQDRERLLTAVGRSRSRVLGQFALREAVWALTIAALGPTLLLALGRHWFPAPGLILFLVAGVAFGAWQLRRRAPSLYTVSRALDLRLATQDQISTAVHYLDSGDPVAAVQRRAAVRLAEDSRPETLFPLTAPRSLYALAAVLLIASGLWAIRQILEKPPLLEHSVPGLIARALRGEDRPSPNQPAEVLEARQAARNKQGAQPYENQDLQGQQQPDPTATAAAGNAAADRPDEAGKLENVPGAEGFSTGDDPGDPMASDLDDPIQSYEDMLDRDAKSGLSKADSKEGRDGEGNASDGKAASQEASSLLNKLREAMNNMLARMQQKAPGSSGRQQAQGSPSNQGAEQQEGRGEGKGAGQPQPGQQAGEGEGAEGEATEGASQSAAAKTAGKSGEGGPKGNAGDGAGSQEGDKKIQDALQEEALGKLSELYGRRGANVSGDFTVEAQAGKQTLRTPQSARSARHTNLGGDISRDEIPPAYQDYVKEYFNKLRANQPQH